VDKALKVRREDRWQTCVDWKTALNNSPGAPRPSAAIRPKPAEWRGKAHVKTLRRINRAQVAEAMAETQKVYPQLADPNSPQFLLLNRISNEMRDPGHPDHEKLFDPSSVRFIADQAAAMLGIEPLAPKK
jgi:hypothetical protein